MSWYGRPNPEDQINDVTKMVTECIRATQVALFIVRLKKAFSRI